ncbi:hypothetical protein NDU88_000737 [Pleurodeles waltl]|uniref:Uncharacterized protein n=1 Tax=Pleurodeles waltl TaxID=8319 RepID=A0AAV7SXJ8_PLEWA|nr:hypothetical protein NDU88_000737 [Pleurodeles waltl]
MFTDCTLESPAIILVVHGEGFHRLKSGGEVLEEEKDPEGVRERSDGLPQDEETEEWAQREKELRYSDREGRERRTRSVDNIGGEVIDGDRQSEITSSGKPESEEEILRRGSLDGNATAQPQSCGPRQVPCWGWGLLQCG